MSDWFFIFIWVYRKLVGLEKERYLVWPISLVRLRCRWRNDDFKSDVSVLYVPLFLFMILVGNRIVGVLVEY